MTEVATDDKQPSPDGLDAGAATLIGAHVLVALLALGARSDAARRVSTPTPAVVTPTRDTSQPATLQRTAPPSRQNDRGVLLLLLLSIQRPR